MIDLLTPEAVAGMRAVQKMMTNEMLLRVLGLDALKHVTGVTIEMRPRTLPLVTVTVLPYSAETEFVQRFELVPLQEPPEPEDAPCPPPG